jgi:hypothetical protein
MGPLDAAGQNDVGETGGATYRLRDRREDPREYTRDLSVASLDAGDAMGRFPMRKGPDARGLCISLIRFQRFAMYIVTSKPKRISVYAGLLHMATSR